MGSTGRGAPHSWEHWKGAPLFVSRQCFPNKEPADVEDYPDEEDIDNVNLDKERGTSLEDGV